jgi:hypothetical protein
MHPDRRELERHLLNHREDEETWRVYSDLLVEAGEPTGELATLHHADRPGLAQNHVFRHRGWFFGELWPQVRDGVLSFEWAHGHVIAASVAPCVEQGETIAALLRLPVARFLDALTITDVFDDTITLLDADPWPLRGLRWLRTGSAWPTPRVAPLFPNWPWLEALEAPEHALPAATHPTLRSLKARLLLPGQWGLPALVALDVAENGDTLGELLASAGCPGLERLALDDDPPDLVSALLDSRCRDTLTRLEFASLSAASAARLVEAKGSLPALTQVLARRFHGDKAERAALRGTFKKKASSRAR